MFIVMVAIVFYLFFSVSKHYFGKYLSLEEKGKNRSKIRKGEGEGEFANFKFCSIMYFGVCGGCFQRLLCLNPTTVMVVLLLGLWLLLGCDNSINFRVLGLWLSCDNSSINFRVLGLWLGCDNRGTFFPKG